MFARALRLGLFAIVLGCDAGAPVTVPDSGYGAHAPVPATKTCKDLCARSADCVVALCDENMSTTSFVGIRDAFESQCLSSCSDATLAAMATDASWRCLFDSTCRQVFERDVCMAHASYTC
jgi:hypothetical protein